MLKRQPLLIALFFGLLAGLEHANAESLRCSNGSVSEGDTKSSLLYKCGPPLIADRECASGVIAQPGPGLFYDPFAPNVLLPCLPVDIWLYDRGPNNLPVTVRLKDGRIVNIVYGKDSR